MNTPWTNQKNMMEVATFKPSSVNKNKEAMSWTNQWCQKKLYKVMFKYLSILSHHRKSRCNFIAWLFCKFPTQSKSSPPPTPPSQMSPLEKIFKNPNFPKLFVVSFHFFWVHVWILGIWSFFFFWKVSNWVNTSWSFGFKSLVIFALFSILVV